MAFEEKKFLDLAGLQSYDAKIKAKIAAADKTLDDAIKAVSGDLKAEVQNRKDADTAINNKIGEVAEGLHQKSTDFFRKSITRKLHEAMEPQELK